MVTPARTNGGTRRYTRGDIQRLRRVAGLLASGVNLAGIEMVLDLQDDNQPYVTTQMPSSRVASADEAASKARSSP